MEGGAWRMKTGDRKMETGAWSMGTGICKGRILPSPFSLFRFPFFLPHTFQSLIMFYNFHRLISVCFYKVDARGYSIKCHNGMETMGPDDFYSGSHYIGNCYHLDDLIRLNGELVIKTGWEYFEGAVTG